MNICDLLLHNCFDITFILNNKGENGVSMSFATIVSRYVAFVFVWPIMEETKRVSMELSSSAAL